MKLTKRKGFNFFRSYFDVYNELESNIDKVEFIDALLNRQFLGIKPTEIKGMAKFAYISQTNSIDSQVRGYEDKTKTKLNPLEPNGYTPTQGGCQPNGYTPTQGGCQGGTAQVEEKGEVQGEEKGEESITIENNKFSDFDSETLYPVETLASVYSEDKKLLVAVSKTTGLSEDGILSFLPEFVLHLNAEGRGKEKPSEFARYFRNKYAASKSNNYTTATQRASADFKWKWSGQATKSGNRREYEADKKNFGQFKFETLKTPNGNE